MATVLYFLEERTRRAQWFSEVDRDTNSREQIVTMIRTRDADPVKVLEVIEPCEEYPRGQCLDVTAEIKREAGIGDDYTNQLSPSDRLAWLHDHKRGLRI